MKLLCVCVCVRVQKYVLAELTNRPVAHLMHLQILESELLPVLITGMSELLNAD